MKKHVFALLALAITGSVMAQNTITDAAGVATVTDPSGSVLQSVRIGDEVESGSTLSTTESVTVRLEGGCTATLSAGQSMVVNPTACEAFLALQTAPAAGAGVFTPVNLALGVGGLALLNEATKSNSNPISNN